MGRSDDNTKFRQDILTRFRQDILKSCFIFVFLLLLFVLVADLVKTDSFVVFCLQEVRIHLNKVEILIEDLDSYCRVFHVFRRCHIVFETFAELFMYRIILVVLVVSVDS